MATKKFKKNDLVIVTAGRDKGKTGKILLIDHKNNKVVVEGIAQYKRTIKPTQNTAGGIKTVERPIDLAKVSIAVDGKAVRIGLKRTKNKTVRINKKTGKEL